MFSHQYFIRYGDYLDMETVKPASLLDMVQDISTLHSDACGYDMYTLHEKNLCWILQGLKLRLEQPVSVSKPVEIFTAVKNMKGVTSERGCILRQDGVTVAKTIANWVLFDSAAGKLCRIPKDMGEAYGFHDFEDDFFSYGKPATAETSPLWTLRVSRREIDTNNHLNNQKSAEILMDALPEGFRFKDLALYYKKSAYEGDVLTLCRAEIENGWYVELKTEDGELCVAGRFTK